MQFTCPLCHSHHATRLALVQAKGRSRSRGWSLTGGVGGMFSLALTFISLPFRFLGFGGIARNLSYTETVLARETAPPHRVPVLKMALFGWIPVYIFFGLPLTGMAISLAARDPYFGSLFNSLIGIGMLAFYIASLVAGDYYNRKVWPLLEAVWQRTFLCGRCGANYIVPDYDPCGRRPVRSDQIGQGGSRFSRRDGLPRAKQPEAQEQARAKAEQDLGRW
ncbi:hypothetical protein BMS3Bbin13_00104 [bacterium BMS3Bbin13]|nr:hypothetical protein BMS3Bbin13_00104 [bacterium BMS3Bbin13]